MRMLAGDLSIMSNYIIHRGGAVPRDAPAGSTPVIAFAAIATRRVHYETTVPIIPPPWADAPAQQPSPPTPKRVHCTVAQGDRMMKTNPPPEVFRL